MTYGPCDLSELALVGLGYKSLQNAFFYLDGKRISEFHIEKRFLRPIFRMVDLNTDCFLQTAKPSRSLFYCNHKETDLRGTGALRYIRAMANRPATAKKQSGKAQTISQALAAQGGKYWYAPKAQTHKSHIWIRKAFDAVYDPFLFEEEAVLDQRCNFVKPRTGIDWECLAGVLSSSLFALALESQGAASLGAGALELPTKKLRSIPVFDVRRLSEPEKVELIRLARNAWKHDQPVDWREQDAPGANIRGLDEWLLSKVETSFTSEKVYSDITQTCRARFRLAEDKQTRAKKSVRQDIEAVAKAVAESVRPILEAKRFPEAFFPLNATSIPFQLGGSNALVVRLEPMLSEALVSVRDGHTDRVLLDKNYPRDVGQVILRSLLMGRKEFSVPAETSTATSALDAYLKWFPSILSRIKEGCRNAALGTRFEEQVLNSTMKMLELHPRLGEKELFGEFNLS